jgi:hypothetical protein
MAPPKCFVKFWGRSKPSNWMTSSDSLIPGVICNSCEICNNLHLSWHVKDYPWIIITSFVMPMKPTLTNDIGNSCQIIFPLPRVGWLR